MASTNKTTYYDLSQYTANDKPTYLVDYNSDMANIDTGIHEVDVKAGTSITNIGTMTDLQTTEKATIVGAVNEVKASTVANATNIAGNTTNIGTLANLDTTTKSDLVNAINELKSIIDNFNLTTYNNLTFTTTDGSIDRNDIKIATNSDGSLCKIYGSIRLTGYQPFATPTIKASSSLRPTSDITITGFSKFYQDAQGNVQGCDNASITIKTNGDIEISSNLLNNTYTRFILAPCLIYIKDFGDVPPVQ
jgi:hypothetical protein